MSDRAQNANLFLERRSYRRRRVMDALRMLPIVGVLLWMLPVFWPSGDAPEGPAPVAMSSAVTYVFVVWSLLILAGVALWWVIGDRAVSEPEREP